MLLQYNIINTIVPPNMVPRHLFSSSKAWCRAKAQDSMSRICPLPLSVAESLSQRSCPPKLHVYPLISIASKAQFCLMLFSFHSESFHWQVIQDLEDPEKQEPFISCSSWICVDGIANSWWLRWWPSCAACDRIRPTRAGCHPALPPWEAKIKNSKMIRNTKGASQQGRL